MAKSKSSLGRNWGTIVYLDSAPPDWKSILVSHKIPCFISPLHDKDFWSEKDEIENPDHVAGEVKKPHHHVMMMFEGNKSREQMVEIFQSFAGVGAERIESLRGAARYLCHLDDPDKFVYPMSETLSFCGADYDHCVNLPKDRYTAIREMMQYCLDNKVLCYGRLLTYAMWHRDDWFRSLCDNSSYVMEKFISSIPVLLNLEPHDE